MDFWINLKTLADILNAKEDTILKRIRRGMYTKIRQKGGNSQGRGGRIWEIRIDDPAILNEKGKEWVEKWKATIVCGKINQAKERGETDEEAILNYLGVHPESQTVKAAIAAGKKVRKKVELEAEDRRRKNELSLFRFNQLPEKKRISGNARYEVLKACATFLMIAGQKPGSPAGIHMFVNEYNSRRINLESWVFAEISQTSVRSIFRWRTAYDKGGMCSLADDYESRSGATSLTADQQKLVIVMKLKYPDCSMKYIHSSLESRGITANIHAIRRFIKRWLKMNASIYLYMTNPDEWRNKHMFAFGSASESIVRLNQLWEMDSTPGDVMLQDGRFTVIGIIDVFPRRLKLHVAPTSKAVAVAALLRRAILEWGVMEVLKTDNGKDYTSKHIERIVEDVLGSKQILCPSCTPEAKPHIERAFRTFSHGIVVMLPGYIGHSVEDRKAIEARKSFAERLCKKGETVEVKMTSLEFQRICDRWVDAVYMHNPHEGLNGESPAEVVRNWTSPIRMITEERALDVLLNPAPKNNGFRTVGKEGIDVDNRKYISPEFVGLESKRVRVLIDDTDLGHAYIFAETGEFICIAECCEWLNISSADLAIYSKAKQKAFMTEQRKELRNMIKQLNVDDMAEEIVKFREAKIANIAEFPKQKIPHTTYAIQEAAKAVLDKAIKAEPAAHMVGPIEVEPHVLEGEKKREQKLINFAESRKLRDVSSSVDVYFMILKRIKDGTATTYQRQWMEDYEEWDETLKKKGLFRDDPFCLNDPEEKKEKEIK